MNFDGELLTNCLSKGKNAIRRTSWRSGYHLRAFDNPPGLALCIDGKDWTLYCFSYEDRIADDWEIVT